LDDLRTAFKVRYHQFKLLLNANNNALEIMAEIEEALRGSRPLGMKFVRSRSTRISTSVWQMVKNLNDLARGKYEELFTGFKEIQQKINPFLHHKKLSEPGPLVLPLESLDGGETDQVGAKVANLGEIANRLHLKVSDGFAVTARAYERFMEHSDLQAEIDRRIQATNVERMDELYKLSTDLQQLIIRSPLPRELEEAISEHYRMLEEKKGEGVTLAIRSSALGEDLVRTSFAGQYRSELNVSRENLFQAYREVVASKYGVTAMTYRLNRGIPDEDVAMCVGCMAMVDARSGGVVYSRNPLDFREDTVVINAVWGLPKSVVDGSAATDLFVISRTGPMKILHKHIPRKDQKFVCYPDEGVCRMEVSGDMGSEPSLTDDEALELARLAVRLEEYYGLAQDIEWAVDREGSITLLQCRPLKQTEAGILESPEGQTEDPAPVILKGGLTASPGAAAGPVFMGKRDMDALRFPAGAVLVTAQPLPRWATILNRAAAVITEQGSVAGHLATVAREFSVPALFGVRDALKILKDDQLVTVDADGLRIYEGRVESLLIKREGPKNPMEGSPVFEALKGAASLIVPLNLLDPDSPEFKPRNCRTFHDITRFCHEKAVQEMFQFGKEHHFPERSSKQLFYQVPMKWWILNLDDGFREEVEGKYVRLENIVSIPMLALWEGIIAVPWEGPPPVDGKGFMSVMFQATTNPALVSGLRSKYADRNYFMISKNYCSLSSRVGFHFSIIESLVSERASENYISFQFKGGAADPLRRQKRIMFISEILENYGFVVQVKDDHLIARLENRDLEFMKSRLKLLGHLTMHTRQLDMIMSNDASVDHYRVKIKKDLHALIGPPE